MLDHARERTGIELRHGGQLGTGNTQPHLQVFFVADQHIHVAHDALQHLHGPLLPAGDAPELGPIVEVERNNCARRPGRLRRFNRQFGCRWRERGKDAAAVEPAHAALKELLPIEIAGFELRGRLVATVVKHYRRADAMPSVAINRRHVWAPNAVVLESLVERFDADGSHTFGDQLTDRIIHERRGDAGAKTETIREVGSHVEFAAADVDLAFGGFAKWDDSRVEPMDQGAERQKVQRPGSRNIQAVLHRRETARNPARCLAENPRGLLPHWQLAGGARLSPADRASNAKGQRFGRRRTLRREL